MPPERRLAFATLAVAAVLTVATVVVYQAPQTPAGQATAAPAATPDGATVFRAKGCVVCHTGPGTAGEGISVAPALTGLADRAGSRIEGVGAADYVRQSILAPGAFLVPGYDGLEMPTLLVSPAELDALVDYLLEVGAS